MGNGAEAYTQALRGIFAAALAAVSPRACMGGVELPRVPGRSSVVAVGKAAPGMAATLLASLNHESHGVVEGLVVTRYGHVIDPGLALPNMEILEAGHPVPDAASLGAGARVLELARSGAKDDQFVLLLSGGASSLVVQPVPGVSLTDIQAMNRALLGAGAAIGDINCVRKKLSRLKGGRLAVAAAPARIEVIAISDVPGDDPAMIGSGPCAPDNTTLADAREIIRRYGIQVSDAVRDALAEGQNEPPAADDAAFARVGMSLVARNADALAAGADSCRAVGYRTQVLGDDFQAPAVELAREHARLVRKCVATAGRRALISGGETTVDLQDLPHAAASRGGRNTEYLLALAVELDGLARVHALAADTDGIDGNGDHAGAVIGPDTCSRAREAGLDPVAMLAAHRSYDFFAALDDLVITGPTGTNVNDFRVILVDT